MQCHIALYWNSKLLTFFKDTQGRLFSFITAFEQLLAMNRDIIEGKFNPTDWQPAKVKERLLSVMLTHWLEQKKAEILSGEFSYGTYHSYRSAVDTHIIPKLGHMDIREIRFSDLEEFKDKLPRDIKLKTKRNILNALHAALRWMWRKGMITQMPPFPVIKGNDAEQRIALSLEEQYEALAKIPEEHRHLYEFEFETGIRPGELSALKIKDIDMEAQTVCVRRTFTMCRLRESDKEGHRKTIPLSDRAFEIAQKCSSGRFPDDWLFVHPKTGKHHTVKCLWLYWKEYTKLPCTHYEGTRHSFCTQIAEFGDKRAAQDLMRHADSRSTDRYIHNRTEYLRDVLKKRGEVVELKRQKKG